MSQLVVKLEPRPHTAAPIRELPLFKGALPPETEVRNRKLTVFAMSLYFFFCVLWAYFVVTGGMSTNRGLQQAKFEE